MRDYSDITALLEPGPVSPFEAEKRAMHFLKGQGLIIAELALVESKMYADEDVLDILDADCLLTAPDGLSNAALRGAHVTRNPERREKKKVLSNLKARQAYLTRLYRTFENAHVFYRQKTRADA